MVTAVITDQEFENEVINAATPVVVDFSADWADPCQMIAPLLDELSAEYGETVKIAKLNTDYNAYWADRLGVNGIPALFIFKDGEMIAEKAGAAPKAALKSWIDEFLE